MRMAVRHRLMLVIVGMLTLLLIMLMVFIGTMGVIVFQRGMLMGLVLHLILLMRSVKEVFLLIGFFVVKRLSCLREIVPSYYDESQVAGKVWS